MLQVVPGLTSVMDPLRPFTMLRVGPGSNRSTGIDKLVASRTVEQS